jgi:hypothetical protein
MHPRRGQIGLYVFGDPLDEVGIVSSVVLSSIHEAPEKIVELPLLSILLLVRDIEDGMFDRSFE